MDNLSPGNLAHPTTPPVGLGQPAPSLSDLAQPVPSQGGPAQPAPSLSGLAQLAPSQGGPAQPTISLSDLAQLAPSQGGLAQPAAEHRDDYGLTESDRRLLYELSTGRSDKRVAARLDTSDRTVRRRMSAMMRSFGISSRFSLGVVLGQLGIVRITLPVTGPAGPDDTWAPTDMLAPPTCHCQS